RRRGRDVTQSPHPGDRQVTAAPVSSMPGGGWTSLDSPPRVGNRAQSTTATPRKLELGRVGELVPRADAIPKTAGRFAYASDLWAAGMLWGHTVRSPHAHARIAAIDIAEAVAMPGVHAVLTHEDVPGAKLYGLEFPDQPVLAIDRVRFFG